MAFLVTAHLSLRLSRDRAVARARSLELAFRPALHTTNQQPPALWIRRYSLSTVIRVARGVGWKVTAVEGIHHHPCFNAVSWHLPTRWWREHRAWQNAPRVLPPHQVLEFERVGPVLPKLATPRVTSSRAFQALAISLHQTSEDEAAAPGPLRAFARGISRFPRRYMLYLAEDLREITLYRLHTVRMLPLN